MSETPFSMRLLLRACLSNNLYTLVVAASLAYTVSKINLAALGALYEIGGSLKLPNAGTSFHFSRVRNFSLWYCHCNNLLCEYATHAFSCIFIYYFSFGRATSEAEPFGDRSPFWSNRTRPRSDFCRILSIGPCNPLGRESE